MYIPSSCLSLGPCFRPSRCERRKPLAPGRAIFRALLASAMAALLCIATSTAPAMNLTVEDSGYAAACAPAQWHHTETQLRASAGVHADALARLVYTYLCGTGVRAKRSLMRAAPQYVWYVNDHAGGPNKTGLIPRDAAVSPRESFAWSADVRSTEGPSPEITVTFHVNEACVHRASIRRVAAKWLIVAVADACD